MCVFFLRFTRSLFSLCHCKWKTVGSLKMRLRRRRLQAAARQLLHVACLEFIIFVFGFRLLLLFLLRLQLFANTVRYDFAPIDLGSGDGQLTTHRLERGIRHGLIVLRYSQLILVLSLLDEAYHLLGQLLFIGHHQTLAAILRGHQLHVAILIVVHLHLQHTLQIRRATAHLEADMPLRAPSAVPVVLRLELVVLNANCQCHLVALRFAKHGANLEVSLNNNKIIWYICYLLPWLLTPCL